jgi:hypothetical protein
VLEVKTLAIWIQDMQIEINISLPIQRDLHIARTQAEKGAVPWMYVLCPLRLPTEQITQARAVRIDAPRYYHEKE